MKTDGPAISFFTSCWLLPQKEQYRVFSLEEPFFSAMGGMPFQSLLNDNQIKTALSVAENAVMGRLAA
jgi:hypothetical protein